MPTIGLIRIQQFIRRPAFLYSGDFPSEVMYVCKSAVEAKTACWGKRVSCIPGTKIRQFIVRSWAHTVQYPLRGVLHEDILYPILLRNLAAQDPGPETEYVEWNIFTDCSGDSPPAECLVPRW